MEVNQSVHEVLTEKQQLFADFVAKHVKPIEKTLRDTKNYHQANLNLDPKGQLTPITEVTLLKYQRVAIKGELEEDRDSSETYPHTVWGAIMKNGSFGINSSLYLTPHEGFTYVADEYSDGGIVSDDFGKNILDALVSADEAGLTSPA